MIATHKHASDKEKQGLVAEYETRIRQYSEQGDPEKQQLRGEITILKEKLERREMEFKVEYEALKQAKYEEIKKMEERVGEQIKAEIERNKKMLEEESEK